MTLFDKVSIDADRQSLVGALCYGIDVLGELPLLLEARSLLAAPVLSRKEIRTVEHAMMLVDLGVRNEH